MSPLIHSLDLRIYHAETDAQGIVYHANYLNFMERGRTEMLRALGFTHGQLLEDGPGHFVAGDVALRYKASAFLDDLLTVETSIAALGNASVKFRQNILRRVADTESLLLEGSITLIYLGPNGKPARIPQQMRDALQPYLMTQDT